MQPDEEVFAFLDDLYVLTKLPRARAAREVVAGEVEATRGIASNHGKTRMFGCAANGIVAALVGRPVGCDPARCRQRGSRLHLAGPATRGTAGRAGTRPGVLAMAPDVEPRPNRFSLRL